MKINFSNMVSGKLICCIFFAVVSSVGQVIVYQPNKTRYLLTGSWAIGSNAVSAVTRNDTVIQCIPAGAGKIPGSLSVESTIIPSEGGFSIDMVAPNPWFDCVVYREFNRETSRFVYTAKSNDPRTIFEEKRTEDASLFESEKEDKRVGVSFAWSPDGKSAICITGKKIQILTYKPSNASFTIEKTVGFEGNGLFSPSWYDTSAVLFVQNRNILKLDIASGKLNPVRIDGGNENAYYYDISVSSARPEYCMVVCASSANDNLKIWMGKFTGSRIQLLKRLPPEGRVMENTKPVWSRQGNRVAYITGDRSKGGRNWQRNISIVSIKADGQLDSAMVVPFECSAFADASPCWSADGSTLWFICEDNGTLKTACIDVMQSQPVARGIPVYLKGKNLDGMKELAGSGGYNDQSRLIVVAAPRATQEILVSSESLSGNISRIKYPVDSQMVLLVNSREAADEREDDCILLSSVADSISKVKLQWADYLAAKERLLQRSFWVGSFGEYYREMVQALDDREKQYSFSPCESGRSAVAGEALKKQIAAAKLKMHAFISSVKDSLKMVSDEEFDYVKNTGELYLKNLGELFEKLNRNSIPWQNQFFSCVLREYRSGQAVRSSQKVPGPDQITLLKIERLKSTASHQALDRRVSLQADIRKARKTVTGVVVAKNSVGAILQKLCLDRLDSLAATVESLYLPVTQEHAALMGLLTRKDISGCCDKITQALENLDKYLVIAAEETASIQTWFTSVNSQARPLTGLVRKNPKYFLSSYDEAWKIIDKCISPQSLEERPFSQWPWESIGEAGFTICKIESVEPAITYFLSFVDQWIARQGEDKKIRSVSERWQKIKERITGDIKVQSEIVAVLKELQKKDAIPDDANLKLIESGFCEQCIHLKGGGKCK